jgi:hypothetical protein
MADNPQNSINPIVLPIESVETASRNFLVNDRKTLRITKITKIVFETLTKTKIIFLFLSGQVSIIRQDPRTQRELDLGGGFSNLLTRGTDESLERNSRFVNLQTSLFIDIITSGNISGTPSLETTFEQNNTNTRILTAIASELESCCTETKAKVDELSILVTTQFRRLRYLLVANFSSLETEAKENFEKLTNIRIYSYLLFVSLFLLNIFVLAYFKIFW